MHSNIQKIPLKIVFPLTSSPTGLKQPHVAEAPVSRLMANAPVNRNSSKVTNRVADYTKISVARKKSPVNSSQGREMAVRFTAL